MTDMTPDTDTLRRQLQQLKTLHEEGSLGAEIYQEHRGALERRLIEQVMSSGPVPASAAAPAHAQRPSRLLLGGAAAFVVVVAVAGYWLSRSSSGSSAVAAADAAAADPAASAPHALTPEQMAGMIDQLAARLKDKPDDADGWSMLARSYVVVGRQAEAVNAYARAVALRGDDPVLLADQADALAVQNGRRVSGEPLKVVERALKLDPNNLKALSLAGTAAFERADYAGAVRHWERILQVAPPDDRLAQDARGAIAEARELGKLPAAASQPGAAGDRKPAVANAGAGVAGVVTLDPALAGRTRPDDTLFVFARDAGGGRMPLAILRRQVKDLPLQFRLDDSQSMSPAAKLSGATQVVVGARISRSGNAMPQPDDLSGQSAQVPVGTTGLTIVISQAPAR
jgi:cytochrome c-type biogenesis protein CcmH